MYGHFISLWQRGAVGRWQVAFDPGIGHAQPTGADAFLVAPPATAHRTNQAAIDSTRVSLPNALQRATTTRR